uniref:Transmembrane protein n=1 Tax=Heterorhabditis bacteriophora TaxID=37862 RepID=A0A1I7WUL0_HETBA
MIQGGFKQHVLACQNAILYMLIYLHLKFVTELLAHPVYIGLHKHKEIFRPEMFEKLVTFALVLFSYLKLCYLDVRRASFYSSQIEQVFPLIKSISSLLHLFIGSNRCILMCRGDVLASVNSSDDDKQLSKHLCLPDVQLVLDQIYSSSETSIRGDVTQVNYVFLFVVRIFSFYGIYFSQFLFRIFKQNHIEMLRKMEIGNFFCCY